MSEAETIPEDTTSEAYARQLEVLRGLDVNARAAMTFELSDNLRQIVWDGVRSRLQMQDVLGVPQMQYENLDKDCLWKWAKVLGVQDKLAEPLEQARKNTE